MPLVEDGSGFRNFSSPTVFQCDEVGQIEQFDLPVDKAYMFVGDPPGSIFQIWRFDIESSAIASSTVVVPLNLLYVDFGRWIKMPISGGGGGGDVIFGTTDPEGVQAADQGTFFWDTVAMQLWLKVGGGSGNTGWILLLGL